MKNKLMKEVDVPEIGEKAVDTILKWMEKELGEESDKKRN